MTISIADLDRDELHQSSRRLRTNEEIVSGAFDGLRTLQSSDRLQTARLEGLLRAALEYYEQSSGGEHPLIAGARLRLAAKEWAREQKDIR